MSSSRRSLIYVVFLGLLLALAFVFRSFLFDNFARPLAILFWFILRLFSAVDQKIYWILLIFFTFFLAVRHIPKPEDSYAQYPEAASRSALENVKNWRALILLTTSSSEIVQHNLLRHSLVDLLTSLYGLEKEDGTAAYHVYDALKSQEISLPDPVYRFLFLEAPAPDKTLMGVVRRIGRAPRQWLRRLRGQDIAEYHQSIDAVLTFMETALEMSHDNQSPKPHDD